MNFFDVLYCNGKNCTELSYKERRENLEKYVKEGEFAKYIPMSIVIEMKMKLKTLWRTASTQEVKV